MKNRTQFAVLAALIAVQILFGMNYVVAKVVVDAFPPLVWATIRVIFASLILFGVAWAMYPNERPRDGWKFYGPLIYLSLLGILINQGSFLIGLRYTTATNSAILNTLIPIFTLLVVTLRGQEPVTWKRLLGFTFAFSGVLVIRRVEEFTLSNKTVLGDLLMVLNSLSYALFLSFGKKFLERYNRVWTTAWMFFYGTIGFSLVSSPDWITFQPPEIDMTLALCMVFAILGGTILTYFLNMWALARTRSSSVAIFIYIQPVVAAGLAWAWKGEPILPRTVASSLLIFFGMLLSLKD